jgi:hypothetical protein
MESIQIEITFNDIDFVYNWKYYISLQMVFPWFFNKAQVILRISALQSTLL